MSRNFFCYLKTNSQGNSMSRKFENQNVAGI